MKVIVSNDFVQAITRRNKNYRLMAERRLEKYRKDPEKKAREKKQLCKYCFYLTPTRLGAISRKHCSCCGVELEPDSINAFCLDCARKYELCSHCGGDVEERENREPFHDEKVGAEAEKAKKKKGGKRHERED